MSRGDRVQDILNALLIAILGINQRPTTGYSTLQDGIYLSKCTGTSGLPSQATTTRLVLARARYLQLGALELPVSLQSVTFTTLS